MNNLKIHNMNQIYAYRKTFALKSGVTYRLGKLSHSRRSIYLTFNRNPQYDPNTLSNSWIGSLTIKMPILLKGKRVSRKNHEVFVSIPAFKTLGKDAIPGFLHVLYSGEYLHLWLLRVDLNDAGWIEMQMKDTPFVKQ